MITCDMCGKPFNDFERIHFVRRLGEKIYRQAVCMECCRKRTDYSIWFHAGDPCTRETCSSCGGPLGDTALYDANLNCTNCGTKLSVSVIDIDPWRGLNLACHKCHRITAIPPDVICDKCNRWLVPGWNSKIFLNTEGITILHKEVQERWYDKGDGTIRDNSTGLVWQKKDDGQQRDFNEAEGYCEKLSLAGLWDWRLPTVAELRSIVINGRRPSVDERFFPETKVERYWTRDEWPDDPNIAYILDFAQDGVDITYFKYYKYYVRAVRIP
jgi:hypothetical protein